MFDYLCRRFINSPPHMQPNLTKKKKKKLKEFKNTHKQTPIHANMNDEKHTHKQPKFSDNL